MKDIFIFLLFLSLFGYIENTRSTIPKHDDKLSNGFPKGRSPAKGRRTRNSGSQRQYPELYEGLQAQPWVSGRMRRDWKSLDAKAVLIELFKMVSREQLPRANAQTRLALVNIIKTFYLNMDNVEFLEKVINVFRRKVPTIDTDGKLLENWVVNIASICDKYSRK